MTANIGDPGDMEVHHTTLDREMAAFDLLDPRIREFIRNMPLNFSAEEALSMQRTFGVEETLRTGYAMLENAFPGWRPI